MRLLALAAVSVVSASAMSYQLLVAETAPGSNGPAFWAGIQRYNIAGSGAAATAGNGIDKTLLNDPAGLAINSAGELFVGNRHGNGAASSVDRFNYNSGTDMWDANGDITGNSLFGAHGLNFSKTGELFVTNVNGPISRFTFSGGVATANGTMGSGASRDIFFSDDGRWAYVTQGVSGSLLKYDLSNGNLVNTFGIAGAAGLHNGTMRNGSLYVAAFGSNSVHKILFDANGDVASSSILVNPSGAISVDLSPDGQEMYVGSHTGNAVFRYLWNGSSWDANGSIDIGHGVGDILVVPEPATFAVLGLGLLAARRRRK